MLLIQAGVSCKWTNDSQRLLLENFDAIHDSPFHLYHFGLPLSPSSSWLHKHYSAEFSKVVVKGLQAGWGTCSRTVSLKDNLMALAYWKDTIAVGLEHDDIIILDAITGGQMAVLSNHDGRVNSLTFSSDGTSLASGSDDTTLKLWDMQTGGVVRTFQGHTDLVLSVSISSDSTTIASGSEDKTIRLWGIQTGECYCVMGQQESVDCVSFSPTDPLHLMSVSDAAVQQWDTNGHQIKPTYEGQHAAFSLDGTCLVLSGGKVVTVWSSGSGEIVAKCPVPSGYPEYCCFSPDGRLVAATTGFTIYIWDITSSNLHPIETFIGHTYYFASLTFSSSSSSLITRCSDQSVRFWQIGTSPMDPVPSDSKSTSPASATVMSITLQAKDGIAISSDSAGVVRTWDLSTGHCKGSIQTPARGSYCRDVQLVDNRLILVWGMDEVIYIQDAKKGQLLQVVDAPGEHGVDIRISGDGSKVFYLDDSWIQAWSMWTGEPVGKVGHGWAPNQDAMLVMDGLRVWVLGRGWDFGISGASPVVLSGVLPDRPHLDLIGGIKKKKGIFPGIEDTVTGKKVFQPPVRLASPSDFQWDGQYLVAGYKNGEVLILDFHKLLQ